MVRMVSLHLVCLNLIVMNSPRVGKPKNQGSTCVVLAISTVETTVCETTNEKSIQIPLTTNKLNGSKDEMNIEVREGDAYEDCTNQESMFSFLASPPHQSPLNLASKENVNQLASKVKDFFERKKKDSIGFSKNKKRSGSLRGGKSR